MSASLTRAFFGEPSTWLGAQVELNDVHALWGGKRVLVQGDGAAIVTLVDSAQNEQAYRVQIGGDGARRVFEVCAANDVLSVFFPERPRIPEENCSRLTIFNAAGQKRAVEHWEKDAPDQRFEAVRAMMLAVHDTVLQATAPAPPPPPPPQTVPTPPRADPQRLLQALVHFFQQDNWTFEHMPDRPVLRLTFQGKNGKWTCYAQVRTGQDLEQFLFYSVMPVNIPEPRRLAVAEFLTRANYGMALGNFELDFSDGEVRFKTSIDASHSDLEPALIKPMIYTNVLMMDKYWPGIMSVTYANVSPAEAVKQIES